MMNHITLFSLMLKGFGTDLLVVALSAVIPLLLGIGLTLLMHFTCRTPVPKVLRYLSIVTESLVPTAVLFLCFFSIPQIVQNAIPAFRVSPLPAAVTALSVCFLGYMVVRYDQRDSLLKNLLVNGIGLIADLFKWCISIVAIVGVADMFGQAKVYAGHTYEFVASYIPVLAISFVVLAIFYIARQLCKDLLK